MGFSLLPYSEFRTTTWSVLSGTPTAGYGLDKLTDLDPSNPLIIEEDTIELEGTMTAALQVDVVTIHHHNFPEGTVLTLRMNSAASWGSPIPVEISVVVGPWSDDGFAPNVCFNVAAEYSVTDRSANRYLNITNDSSDSPVTIGEIVVGGALVSLETGMLLPLRRTTDYGVSYVQGKKGPRYIHDRRTRARVFAALLRLKLSDWTLFRQAINASKAMAYPMLVWPTNNFTDEPILGRWGSTIFDELDITSAILETGAVFEELAFGEAY